MNLDSFTMSTPESEYYRVVRHETGHTLGFPHEHLRRALVARIDVAKAIEYFKRTQGWSEAEVRAQVLTPIEEGSLLGTVTSDQHSIMCYDMPGAITKDGKPIIGGTNIDKWDYEFISLIYPKPKPKPAPRTARKTAKKASRKVAKKRAIRRRAPAKRARIVRRRR